MGDKEQIKIFITGGHISPALAVVEEIRRQNKPWTIIFIGRKYVFEGSRELSEEYRLITGQGIKFIALTTGRLQRSMSLQGLLSLLRVPIGLAQSLVLISRFRPKLILSFGGYIALPVAWAGWFLGIPVLTHEQTRAVGLTNSLIARICRRILVSSPELLDRLPKDKTVVTGLLLRKSLFQPPTKPSFPCDNRLPLIYVTGGTTGAKSLNELLFPLIPKLTRHYMLVHQTGGPSLARAREIQAALPAAFRSHYQPANYFDVPDVAWAYQKAILVIGRSGANTVAEIAILGKVALLVPLPWSAGGEQQANAAWLEKAGSVMVVDQLNLDTRQLEKKLGRVLKNINTFENHAKNFAAELPHDGAARVVSQLNLIINP